MLLSWLFFLLKYLEKISIHGMKYRASLCRLQKYHILFIVPVIAPDNWDLSDEYTEFVSIPSKTGFFIKKVYTDENLN